MNMIIFSGLLMDYNIVSRFPHEMRYSANQISAESMNCSHHVRCKASSQQDSSTNEVAG